MKKYFLIIITVLYCFSCGQKKSTEQAGGSERKLADFDKNVFEDLDASGKIQDIICQNWEFAEDAKDAALSTGSSNIDIVYRGFSLFSDGRMLKDPRGNAREGTWILDELQKPKTLKFTYVNGEIDNFQLAYINPFQLKLASNVDGKKVIIECIAEGIRHKNLSADPFYISNSLWRFKPTSTETDAQVKKRLKDCIHFYILFYDEKIQANAKKVLFAGLPSCFKWYGGGIYIQKKKELDAKWVNSFYNKEQAMNAYKLAEKLMEQKYIWPKKETNWLKLNVAVLRQMESKLDSL